MNEELMTAFDNYNGKGKITNEKISFQPEIKVKRETDTLYISEVRKTKFNLIAIVEVHNGKISDKAPFPIGLLSDTAQKAILIRLRM